MKDLIEQIEAALRTKYPRPAPAFTTQLSWLPCAAGVYRIFTSERFPLARMALDPQHHLLTANNLQLLEQSIVVTQERHVQQEKDLRSTLEKELARLEKK